jgi:transcription antitermination factor NusG
MLHQRRWYAAYVCVRHEKRVAEYLQWGGLDCYLPIYRSTRTWNKRRVEVDLPLFPGYVFVRIALTERLRVLSAPSVVHLVGRGAEPLPLNDAEVDAIRGCLLPQFQAEPAEYLPMGSRVRVVAGPLRGLEGVVVRDNGRARFIVSIDLIMRSIAVNVEGCDLALATPAASRGN